MPTALRKWFNTMIIGYLTHWHVPCQIGDASTLWGPGLLNHEGTCRLQQICHRMYVSEIDTWHHWFRRSIRHRSWTSDASNKPQKYVLIGFDCFNWHIEIGDKPSSAPMLTGQVTDDLWDFLHHIYSGDNWCDGWQLMWPSRFVAVPVCGHFGLWPFQVVAVLVCGRSGLWPFRSVAVPVRGRFGLWPFRLWPFRFVAVSVVAFSVCGRYDLLPASLCHNVLSR